MYLAELGSETVGIGALAAGMVTAFGYMIWDRRDTDKRVDRANATIVDVLAAQRDEALAERDRAREERDAEARERINDKERAARQRQDLRTELGQVYDERNELRMKISDLRARLNLPEEPS